MNYSADTALSKINSLFLERLHMSSDNLNAKVFWCVKYFDLRVKCIWDFWIRLIRNKRHANTEGTETLSKKRQMMV